MPAGRKTKYTPATIEKITHALSVGAPRWMACKAAGINQSTFEAWMKRYPDFTDTVEKAEGTAAVGWLARIEEAAKGGEWTADAWKLERRYPKDFGKRVMVDVEERIRRAATAAGFDPDDAIREAERIMKGG